MLFVRAVGGDVFDTFLRTHLLQLSTSLMTAKFVHQLCLEAPALPQQTDTKTDKLALSLNTYSNRFLPFFSIKMVSNAAQVQFEKWGKS